MKKNSNKKVLSYKIIRDKFSGQNKYPGFHARMIAAMIDLNIIALLFIPLFISIGSLFFFDSSPSDAVKEAILELLTYNQENNSKMDLITFIRNTPKFKEYFITDYGFIKIAFYEIIQLLALPAIILAFWIKKQATPGKMLLSIKIVDATTLDKPSNRQLIIRMLSYIISVLPLFLGVIWLVFDSKKQAWHDKIANTLVIKTQKT